MVNLQNQIKLAVILTIQILATHTEDSADICTNIIPPVNGLMIRRTSKLYQYSCNIGYKLQGAPHYRYCSHSEGGRAPQEEPTCEDLDECANERTCDKNADCINSIGSYQCVCHVGYSGDGKNCVLDKLKIELNKVTPAAQTCGISRKKTNETRKRFRRIIGGRFPEHGEWPWIALITVNEGTVPHFSGVLIEPGWVLSIASLLINKEGKPIDKNNIHISLGKKDRNKPENEEQAFSIKNIYLHPKFRQFESLSNDIALIELDGEATVTDFVNTICMVDLRKSRKFEKQRHLATVAGWGLTNPVPIITGKNNSIKNALFSGVLKDITIPLEAPHRCRKQTAYYFHKKTMLCAGILDNPAAPCIGDGGSPLMLEDTETKKWILLGLFSWSEGCGQPSKYSYYTRVSRYRRWIADTVNLKKS